MAEAEVELELMGAGAAEENAEENAEEAEWTHTRVLDPTSVPESSSNKVSTTKYTRATFFPKAFLLQFRRGGNVWFVMLVVLMLIGSFGSRRLFMSPQPPWGNMFIVVVLFGLNMLQEGLDDRRRAKKDDEANGQRTFLLSLDLAPEPDFVESTWGAVQRGDVIRLDKNCTSPADVLLISTCDMESEPLCYVETSNIDGETYLKKRHCSQKIIPHCSSLRSTVEWLRGRELVYEPPNPSLSACRVAVKPKPGEAGAQTIHLDSSNVILRGAELRNTAWAVGVVLYVGRDTKSLLGQGKRANKQSKVDRVVNQIIMSVFLLLALMLTLTLVLPLVLTKPSVELWYMSFTDESSGVIFPDWLALLVMNVILLRQIVPILIFPLLEFSAAVQASYIGWDLKMRDPDTGRFASCNTTSLAQEIGQVKWIFSDKTGTLTCNEMRLVACSVGGKRYGRATGTELARLATLRLPPLATARVCFTDVLETLATKAPDDPQRVAIERFLKALSLCHTVLVETVSNDMVHRDSTRRLRRSKLSSMCEQDPAAAAAASRTRKMQKFSSSLPPPPPPSEEADLPHYNAESPDESALVIGATALGFQFRFSEGNATIGLHLRRVRRAGQLDAESGPHLGDLDEASGALLEAQARSAQGEGDGTKQRTARQQAQPASYALVSDYQRVTEEWTVLAVNPFSSFRKRMSVLYQDPNTPGRTVLLCKGADNQMLSASQVSPEQEAELKSTLLFYAQNGLRTLVVAEREVEEAEREAWLAKHAAACALMGDERKVALEEVAVEIERDLEVLGVTAVEDRLQEGVPKTISLLREAKINFWLITGDKVETALNISKSADLISTNSEVLMLTLASLDLEAPGPGEAIDLIQQRLLEEITKMIRACESNRTLVQEDPADAKGCCLRMMNACDRKMRSVPVPVDPHLALVVDGETLGFILSTVPSQTIEAAFLLLSRMCGVVIACRASPTQKAQLVGLVKDNVTPKPITLAIGDGANDCPMIERAHIGIGLAGKEGTQAASAADFALGKFRFLAPLLMVHGRLGYLRVSKGITLVFYGNLLFTFASFYYNFVCAFSGTPAFNNLEYIIYQMYLAVPIFILVALDRDTQNVYSVLSAPRSYDLGRLNQTLQASMVDAEIFFGMTHAALAFLLVFWGNVTAPFALISGSLFLSITMVLTFREAKFATSWTWPMICAIIFNIGVIMALSAIISAVEAGVSIFANFRLGGRYFWPQTVSVIFLVTLADLVVPTTFVRARRFSRSLLEVVWSQSASLEEAPLPSSSLNRLLREETQARV